MAYFYSFGRHDRSSGGKKSGRNCKLAGIRPVMIKGDHPLTAAAVGKELDFNQDAETVSGEQLQNIQEDELLRLAEITLV